VDGASDSSNLEDFGGFDDPEGFEDFEDFLGIVSGTGMLDGKRKVRGQSPQKNGRVTVTARDFPRRRQSKVSLKTYSYALRRTASKKRCGQEVNTCSRAKR
jgi:hypothetical protein